MVWTFTEERCLVYWETRRRMLRMELPGNRKRRRPKQMYMEAVREDMAVVEVTEEDAEVRNKWRSKIRCGDPSWEKWKEEETN